MISPRYLKCCATLDANIPCRLPNYSCLVPSFRGVAWMMASIDDVQVIVNCCKMLELVLPGTQDDAISSRCIDLLKYDDEFAGTGERPCKGRGADSDEAAMVLGSK